MKRLKEKWEFPREYAVWASMKMRCSNPKDRRYKSYGGRGIKVCSRWLGTDGFKNFINDMGPRPENTRPREWSIDRIDVNGDYRPENCRWAQSQVQARNMSRNVFIRIWGEKYCVTDACKIFKIKTKSFWTYHYRHPEKKVEDNFTNYLIRLGAKEIV